MYRQRSSVSRRPEALLRTAGRERRQSRRALLLPLRRRHFGLLFGAAMLAAIDLGIGVGLTARASADVTSAWRMRTSVQSQANVAALAAADELPSEQKALQAARRFVFAREPKAALTYPSRAQGEISLGHWDAERAAFQQNAGSKNAVRIVLRQSQTEDASVTARLLHMLGIGDLEIEATAIALRENGSQRCSGGPAAAEIPAGRSDVHALSSAVVHQRWAPGGTGAAVGPPGTPDVQGAGPEVTCATGALMAPSIRLVLSQVEGTT